MLLKTSGHGRAHALAWESRSAAQHGEDAGAIMEKFFSNRFGKYLLVGGLILLGVGRK